MNFTFKAALLPLLVLAAHAPAAAQASFGHAKVAAASATASPATVARGGKGTLMISLVVAPGYHVNAHKLSDPDLIPTDILPAATPGVTWGSPRYPAPKMQNIGGKPAPVYVGRTTIAVPFTVAKSAKAGRLPLSGTLSYQGCNATACFPPTIAPVRATVSVH